jgi:hypothetical protein
MMLGLHGSGLASTTCVFDVGVERGVWLVGVGLAHCWVLKHQAPLLERFGVGGGGVVVLVPPFALLRRLGVVGGWWGCCLRSA